MSRLTRDGTAELVSRDQILRRERGQGNIHFPCSADHEQDWQPYPVDPYSCYTCDHTYTHMMTIYTVHTCTCIRGGQLLDEIEYGKQKTRNKATDTAGRPGSSEVPRNPLTRWDVSSIPANEIFVTKKLKNKNKNAQRVEND